jgi:hypothetical protein
MKPRPLPSQWTAFFLAILSAAANAGAARAQIGTILSGTGPVNRSMACGSRKPRRPAGSTPKGLVSDALRSEGERVQAANSV